MAKHEPLTSAGSPPAAQGIDALLRVIAALNFLKDVTAECHGGNVRLDGLGLSALLGMIEVDAFAAFEALDCLTARDKEVTHG